MELTRQRMTVKALAEKTGFTLSTLRRRLDGKSEFTLDELVRVSEALGLTITELVCRVEVPA